LADNALHDGGAVVDVGLEEDGLLLGSCLDGTERRGDGDTDGCRV
jgi:hypothetical protein